MDSGRHASLWCDSSWFGFLFSWLMKVALYTRWLQPSQEEFRNFLTLSDTHRFFIILHGMIVRQIVALKRGGKTDVRDDARARESLRPFGVLRFENHKVL